MNANRRTRFAEEPSSRRGRRSARWIVLATALLVVGGVAVPLPHSVASAPASPAPSAGHLISKVRPAPLPPVPGFGHPGPAYPGPRATHYFYTQIGSTLSQINGSNSITAVPVLAEVIPVVTSPYPVAYELNGLSDTGDWYQIVISDNWPGCAAGFEEGYETWDNLGGASPVICDPTVAVAAGDRIALSISFDATGNACLGFSDLSTSRSHTICLSQPDAGAKSFLLLQTVANGAGYYSGTMTEFLNETISYCPIYPRMPLVTFDFPSWARYNAYVPWSDEFDLATGLTCYLNRGNVVSFTDTDPSSHYTDTATGTSYSPQWVEGQNGSVANVSVGFRFQTDPVPITSETLTATPASPFLAQRVTLHASTTGGVAPYQVLWTLNGTDVLGWSGAFWNFTTSSPGNYTFTTYALDRQGDISAGASVVVREPFPLWAGPVLSTKAGGADVGQTTVFSARVTGGYVWVSYTWSGLPTGCSSANASSIRCTPTAAGSGVVGVRAKDGNGTIVNARGLPFLVSSDPILRVDYSGIRDVGQTETFRANVTGGSGGLRYVWTQLAPDCTKNGSVVSCPITTTGPWIVGVNVTDSNGFLVTSRPLVVVAYPAESVSLTTATPVVDVGQLLEVTGTASGGSGGPSYRWTGLPEGCTPPSLLRLVCRPAAATNATIGLSVLDRANATASAPVVHILVAPAISIWMNSTTTLVAAPASFEVTVAIAGGSRITSLDYGTFPLSCTFAASGGVSCAGLAPGNYTFSVSVRDVGGGNATAAIHISVHEAPPPPSAPPSGTPAFVWLGAGVAVLLLLALAIGLIARRRRRR